MAEADARDLERIASAARACGMDQPVVEPLFGGTRNRCYRLAGAGRDVVVRIAGDHDEAYAVARQSEARAQQLAAAHGLAPRLLYEDLVAGVMVMDYVPGPVWDRARARSPAGATRAGDWFRRLHAIEVPADVREVDFLASLSGYCGQLDGDSPRRLLEVARRRIVAPGDAQARRFCHNDLHHLNLVESAAGVLALDWEYAGIGDPLMDLAGFAAYHDLDDVGVRALLDAYAGAGVDIGWLEDARWLFEAVWWAWLELKRRLDGSENGDSGEARSRLAVRLGLMED